MLQMTSFNIVRRPTIVSNTWFVSDEVVKWIGTKNPNTYRKFVIEHQPVPTQTKQYVVKKWISGGKPHFSSLALVDDYVLLSDEMETLFMEAATSDLDRTDRITNLSSQYSQRER